jgi:diguanylate cyclase (GGDEF)-like protein
VMQLRRAAEAAGAGDATATAAWSAKVTEVRAHLERGLALGPGDLMSWIRMATLLSQHEAALRGGARGQRDTLADMEKLGAELVRSTDQAEAEVGLFMTNRPGQVTLEPFLGTMGALVDQENADLELFRRDSEAAVFWGKVVAVAGPGLATALAVILGLAVSLRIVRSVRSVSQAAQGLMAGHLDQRVPVGNEDEIGVMARTFNLMADRLAARDREMALLGQLGDLLAACTRLDEAYAVIARIVNALLPQDDGALYLAGAGKAFERAVVWGAGAAALPLSFGWEHCWAVRRGHEHSAAREGGAGVRCGHSAGALERDEVCLPLVAQGEVLAVMCFRLRAAPDPGQASSAKGWLAAAASEPVAMALANLRLRETLQNESIRDPLTGLFNRRFMEEAFVKELSRARREKRPVGVMLLDVDHFKRFNDTFGHAAGDLLLKAVGKLLGGSFRQEDIACRFGGEEFVVVLPGASLEDTARRAEQLRQGTAALQLAHQGTALGAVTASIGVAAFPLHGASGEALLAVADAALYRAKGEGRNRVVVTPLPPGDAPEGDAAPLKAV